MAKTLIRIQNALENTLEIQASCYRSGSRYAVLFAGSLVLADSLAGPDFCLIFAPSKGYDEPGVFYLIELNLGR
jgi:hypothetical protein